MSASSFSQDKSMDVFWAEVADHIEAIEELYEDEKFPNRELAAMVASKVHAAPAPTLS